MSHQKRESVFVSVCGNFIAIRVPSPIQPAFDVWREDGSEMWIGTRYIKAPGSNGYNPQRLYTEDHAKSTKIVGALSNIGHRKRNGTWVEGWNLELYDLKTDESIRVEFHTPIRSLAPQYKKRREKTEEKEI